jgi:choline kinase
MDTKTTAIILCAGVGSRMGLRQKDINKCALPIGKTTPIRHMTTALLQSGVDRIVIITGFAAESVMSALSKSAQPERISFINNQFYDYHGCNYSLSCSTDSEYMMNAQRLIIAEGDSLLHESSIAKLVNSKASRASLLRDSSFIDYTRSVIAIGKRKKITRFEYDTNHTGLPPVLSDNENLIGESMQLWSFTSDASAGLKKLLQEYKNLAEKSKTPLTHSGVYSINKLGVSILPVFADKPDEWINLNTEQDLKKAKEVLWLIK